MRNSSFAEELEEHEYPSVIRTRVNSGWQGKKIRTKNPHIGESDPLPWERMVTRPLPTPLAPDNSLISVVGSGFPDVVRKEKTKKTKRSQSKDLKPSIKSSDRESRRVRKTVRFQSPIEQDPLGIPNMCIRGKTMEASRKYHVGNSTAPSTLPPLTTSPYYQVSSPSGNKSAPLSTGDPCEMTNKRNERLHFLPDIRKGAVPVSGLQRDGRQKIATDYFAARRESEMAGSKTAQVAWNSSESALDRYKKMKKKMYSLY